MLATDFEYDGQYLKNWGCMVCYTDVSSGFETIDNIAKRTFNTVSQFYGNKFSLVSSYYEDRVEISFQICKYDCKSGMSVFTPYEIREIKRWLCRPGYHKFKLIQENWADYYMNGSFNVSELQVRGQTYVLELNFVSDAPFSLHEPIKYKFRLNDGEVFTFFDMSDEEGYIYPDMKITVLGQGDLRLTNSNEDRVTIIENCSFNEEITFTKDLVFYSSIPYHKIQNDFNYQFLRVSNSYDNRKNVIRSSIPVEIEMTYSPYVKVVV